MEVLKQGQYQPLSVERQVIQIYAGTQKDAQGQGWLREVPVEEVGRYLKELLEFLDTRHPDITRKIAEKKQLDDDVKKALDGALQEFKGIFRAEAK